MLVAEIEAGAQDDKFYDAKVKVLSEMIEHHVEEEERRVEGIFSQARRAGLDMDLLGEKMAAEKKALVLAYKASGPPKLETPSFSGTRLA